MLNEHYLKEDMPYVNHELKKLNEMATGIVTEAEFSSKSMFFAQIESSFYLLKQLHEKKKTQEEAERRAWY